MIESGVGSVPPWGIECFRMSADLLQSSRQLDVKPDFTKHIVIDAIESFALLPPCKNLCPFPLSQKQLIVKGVEHRSGREHDKRLGKPPLRQPFGGLLVMAQQGIDEAQTHIQCI